MKKLRDRKIVRFSIRSKILLLVSSITLASLSTFLIFSTTLFSEDKKAYIFESALNNSLNLSSQIEAILKRSVDKSRILSNINLSVTDSTNKLLQHTVDTDQSTIAFMMIKDTESIYPKRENFNQRNLNRLKINSIDISNINQTHKINFETLKRVKFGFNVFKVKEHIIARLTLYNSRDDLYFVYFQQLNDLVETFSQSTFKNILIDSNNDILIDSKPEMISSINLQSMSAINDLLASELNHGVKEVNLNGIDYLLSYVILPSVNYKVLSITPKSTIYSVVDLLKKKSIAFTIFLLSISIMLGTFLARSLNIPIETLMNGTSELAQGNFQHNIKVDSKDELKILSESFNDMSKKILKFMDEVKDKVRMEDELAVAQLVQSSFFPNENLDFTNMEISGHYDSASECGGDWWGCKEINGKTLMFIGDATGHGVPSALITATVNTCFNLLTTLSKDKARLLDKPHEILNLMNEAVYKVGGKILMTFFVAIYDEKTNIIKYSNASHNPPFLYCFNPDNEPSKKDIKLLMDNNGPRLGHISDAVYKTSKIEMTSNDVLLMFTDGIVEATNQEEKQWGERRFIKTFISNIKSSPEKIKESLLKEAFKFYNGVPPDDDITLVIAKRKINETA